MTISGSEKDKRHKNMHFHLQIRHHDQRVDQKKDANEEVKDIPKGCMAVMVGSQGEEQQRFLIPVMYVNHPLFKQLLQEAEDEYGFDHEGPITIPCQVDKFRAVQGIIDHENSLHHHHHHHMIWCFRV